MSRGRDVTGAAFAQEAQQIKALHGEARLAALWAKVEQTAKLQTAELAIEWLKMLMREAWKASRIEFTLRAFGELRRIYETDPRYADLRDDLLWYFKWLVEELPEYAEPSRQVIEDVFVEMERFYDGCGASRRPIYALRCQAAVRMGDRDQAAEWYEKWQDLPRSHEDDCEACDLGRQILFLLDRQQHEDALAAAEPILRGKVWCDETPETLTRLVPAAMQQKRRRLAGLLLRISSRTVRRVPSALGALGSHVLFRFLMGDMVRSRRLAILALRRAREARNDIDRFNVYRACGLWAALAIFAGQHHWTLPARIMPTAPTASDRASIPLADAAGLCLAEASHIAARLDARNGTTRYADYLRELEEKVRHVEHKMRDAADRARQR